MDQPAIPYQDRASRHIERLQTIVEEMHLYAICVSDGLNKVVVSLRIYYISEEDDDAAMGVHADIIGHGESVVEAWTEAAISTLRSKIK